MYKRISAPILGRSGHPVLSGKSSQVWFQQNFAGFGPFDTRCYKKPIFLPQKIIVTASLFLSTGSAKFLSFPVQYGNFLQCITSDANVHDQGCGQNFKTCLDTGNCDLDLDLVLVLKFRSHKDANSLSTIMLLESYHVTKQLKDASREGST